MSRRARAIVCALAAVAVTAAGTVTAFVATASSNTVALAPIVESWPAEYTVAGTKAEPLYTERIRLTRANDTFAVQIEALSPGTAPLGVQRSAVAVTPDGTVTWRHGCTKDAASCAADPALRGFLATAAVLGLARDGRLPAEGVRRDLNGHEVICVDDAELHPGAPAVPTRIDPCFDVATGAVLGHWSDGATTSDGGGFVGATLDPGFTLVRTAELALLRPDIPQPNDPTS